MPGKTPPGWNRKPAVIIDEREWCYTGTRFVSPVGSEIGNVMLFESLGVAESVANHLRGIGMTMGIRSMKAGWMILKRSRLTPIIGTAPPSPQERAAASRKAAHGVDSVGVVRNHNYRREGLIDGMARVSDGGNTSSSIR